MSAYLRMLLDRPTASVTQAKNLDTSNHSILITWMQNRLREHFLVTEARERQVKERKDYAATPKIDKFDVVCHDLKVLDAEVNNSGESPEDWDKFMDIMMGVDPSSRPVRGEHQVYRVGKSRISLTYKTDGKEAAESLHLIAEVGQIDDVDAIEVHPYFPRAERHKIDVHVKVFPVLESWVVSRDLQRMPFSVPQCYFGTCETSKKVSVEVLAKLVSTDEDIMSKVATAMSVDKKTPVVESHRMLLLQDIEREKFELRTTAASKFIPFLNVEAVLKEMAVIHCVSWALTEIEGKRLKEMWPFLSSTSKLSSLIIDRGSVNIPSFIEDMSQYLQKSSIPDKVEIMSALRRLNSSFKGTLERAMKKSHKGPICLIHQCLSSSVVLFRHTLLSDPDASLYEPSVAGSASSVYVPKRPATAYEKRVSFDVTAKLNKKKKHRSESIPTRTSKLPRLVNREVRIVDWQNATIGPPMIDAAFLILTSLPPEIRKYHTDELLHAYWNAFEATAAQFYLNCNWTNEDKYKSYLHGMLFASLVLITKTFPDIIPENSEEHLEVLREALRELVAHKLL